MVSAEHGAGGRGAGSGDREIEFTAKMVGEWMLHCHLPHHMMNNMFPMVGPMQHGAEHWPKDDAEKKKVPGYPQNMWMPDDDPYSHSWGCTSLTWTRFGNASWGGCPRTRGSRAAASDAGTRRPSRSRRTAPPSDWQRKKVSEAHTQLRINRRIPDCGKAGPQTRVQRSA